MMFVLVCVHLAVCDVMPRCRSRSRSSSSLDLDSGCFRSSLAGCDGAVADKVLGVPWICPLLQSEMFRAQMRS